MMGVLFVNDSLFVKLGGREAVKLVVEKMYDKILSNPELAKFFVNTDIKSQHLKQIAFVTYAFGGSPNYSGKSMREAHKNAVSQGLSENHFNLVAGCLKESMQDLNVANDLIEQVLQIVGTTKQDVLNQ
jgi:hemoglobin